ncbi:trigger factor [Erythrobacter arachoides]|uniref:Trigger factor n=1 Tax=Aurantiacibacter arachoides TaxID=1850444 RepID=A0A844ZVQ3_9SPHN|nr:trigger factor [Aurantiacibacter arachoides]MXO92381.1 trigger factor [Aurantiacibacter arachoides]GGD57627.1 trigger factor [Aurantiacibacter arachoides]
MQIVETTNEGLKRAYTLTIPAKDIDAKIDAEVKKVAPQVRMPGFRPGKVPANLVRKMHGEALHADVLNTAVRESVNDLLRDKKLRPALQPRVEMTEGYEQGKDAELKVEVEVLPEIEAPSIDGLKLEKLNVPVDDAQLDEALGRIAEGQKSYKDAPKSKKAADGDQLIIDFTGSVDGVEFEGGKATDAPLVIGSNQFIPGFEEQLVGMKTGEDKTITVTFPADYPAENLKGKEAQFDVHVQQVKIAGETTVDDDFAKSLGLEGLDKLKELLRGQIEQESAGLTRTQMKRQLLDKLAADHDFAVPPTMVEAEFEQIWNQLSQEVAKEDDPAKAMEELEAERDDYKRIAERRVRLGLLLSEIGQTNGVEVSQQEMQMLLQQAAQQYRPEDRERFIEYVRSEPMAQAQLRAPLYEDKVVDFLFDKAEVTEREVTREELEAAIEAEETAPAPAKKAAPKKKAATKTSAKTDDDAAGDKTADTEKPAADKKVSAKKAPAKKAADKKTDAETDADAAEKPAAPKKAAAKKPAAKKAPAKK